MADPVQFTDLVQLQVPLAPFTYLKLGGPAEMLVQPRSREELATIVGHCFEQRWKVPILRLTVGVLNLTRRTPISRVSCFGIPQSPAMVQTISGAQ